MKNEIIRQAYELAHNNTLSVTGSHTEGTKEPTAEAYEAFEREASGMVTDCTESDLEKAYADIMAHGMGDQEVTPATLLCWIADGAKGHEDGIVAESITLEREF